jgi:hypothetical protein
MADQTKMETFQHRLDDLLANPQLSPSDKVTLIGYLRFFPTAPADTIDGHTWFDTYVPDLAKMVGLSKDTVSARLQCLEECGLIERHLTPKVSSTGYRYNQLHTRPTARLLHGPLCDVAPTVPRNHGGNRYGPCPQCGGPRHLTQRILAVQNIVTCDACKTTEVYPPSTMHDPLPATAQDSPSNLSPDELEEITRLVTGETPEENGQNTQEQTEASCFHPTEEVNRSNLPSLSNKGGKPKVCTVPPDQQKQDASKSNASSESIELYLDIAGDYPCHVVMGDKVNGTWVKYKDHKGCVDRGMVEKHIAGLATYGAAIKWSDNTTRLDLWDADSMEQVQVLISAAKKLAQAGIDVFLEMPPLDRPRAECYHEHSARLFVVWSERVAMDASKAAILAIAPELDEISEHWPGPNTKVRLPGGTYVVKTDAIDYRAWCSVTCVSTGKQASDGAAVAVLLQEHQTPITIIPTLPLIKEQQQIDQATVVKKIIPGDVLPAAIDLFDQQHTWEDVFTPTGGRHTNGNFKYLLPDGTPEHTASVHVNPDGKTATNYGRKVNGGFQCLNKVGWYCQVRHLDEKAKKAELCATYRRDQ